MEFAKFLIDNGADVNAKSTYGSYTPLYWATRKNYWGTRKNAAAEQLAKLLIDNGADVNARTFGMTPLHAAIVDKASERVEVGGEDVIKLLIANGADVNARREKLPHLAYGRFAMVARLCPLRYSFRDRASMENIIKLLIDNGADVNALIAGDWNNGYTPLDMAVEDHIWHRCPVALSARASARKPRNC